MTEVIAFVIGFVLAWYLRHHHDIYVLKVWIARNKEQNDFQE